MGCRAPRQCPGLACATGFYSPAPHRALGTSIGPVHCCSSKKRRILCDQAQLEEGAKEGIAPFILLFVPTYLMAVSFPLLLQPI